MTYLCSNNALWVAIQWSCWISGQVAVPLESGQAMDQLRRQASSCKTKLLIATPEFEPIAQELSQGLQSATIVLDHTFVPAAESVSSTSMYAKQLVGTQGVVLTESTLPSDFYAGAPAMLLYTPNAVNNLKPVLLTHRNIDAQVGTFGNNIFIVATAHKKMAIRKLEFVFHMIYELMEKILLVNRQLN